MILFIQMVNLNLAYIERSHENETYEVLDNLLIAVFHSTKRLPKMLLKEIRENRSNYSILISRSQIKDCLKQINCCFLHRFMQF